MLFKRNKDLKIKDRCAKCGACLSFCPVYKSLLLERFSPRGKNYLIHEYSAKNKDQLIKETISACLQCGACSEKCSSKADVANLIRQIRSNFNYYRNIPYFLFDLWRKFGEQKVISLIKVTKDFHNLLQKNNIKISTTDFISDYLEGLPIQNKPLLKPIKSTDKVGFFIGCVQNFIFKDKAYNIIKLLSDIEIKVPLNQTCCGLPTFSQGAFKHTLSFIKKNLHSFQESNVSTIITGCSSCAYMIKTWPKLLSKDEKLLPLAQKIANNTYEFTSFLYKTFQISTSFEKLPLNTLAQIPCHHRFALKEDKNIINFVQNIIKEEGYLGELGCCGFGGSFHIFNQKISETIFQRNVKEKIISLNTSVDAVVTTCSGCLIRLKHKLDNSNIKILHTSDLLLLSIQQ